MKKKKLKLKKKSLIVGVLLLFSTIDFIYLLINMISGAMLTWWGCLTLVIDIIVIVLTSEELKTIKKKCKKLLTKVLKSVTM